MKSRPVLPGQIAPGFLRGLRAFTLVELLVSMAVLSLLLVVVVQMVNSAIAVTTGSTKRLDADSQVRLVFDRMAVDFSQIIKRQDTDYYFQKNLLSNGKAGDDQMAFYSETTGYYPDAVTGSVPKSNAALVGYRIYRPAATPGIFPHLERLNKALVWNGTTTGTPGVTSTSTTPNLRAMTFLPQTLLGAWPGILLDDPPATVDSGTGAVTSPDPYYQTLGESVFRLETCYLVGNANNSPRLSATPYISNTVPPATITATTVLPYNGMRDVIAVVVSLAVLDDTSRQLIQADDLSFTASQLEDVTTDSFPAGTAPQNLLTPTQIWQKHIANNDLTKTSGKGRLPQSAAAQVRFYERYFPLGNSR